MTMESTPDRPGRSSQQAGVSRGGHASDPATGDTPLRAHVVSLLLCAAAPPAWLGLVVAACFLAAESVLMLGLKHIAPSDTFGLIFLLGVLVVSTQWGFGVAAITSVASAFAFDYVRMRPAGFDPTAIENWVAVAVFLFVALVANTVAYLARARAAEADQRRHEAEASRDEVRVLAELQASLRRVATLVAQGVPPSEVFATVAIELARCLGAQNAAIFRYEPDDAAVLVAARDEPGLTKMPVGERFPNEGDNIVAMVLRTGQTARMDSHDHARGPAAARISELGLRGGVGAPIIVEGRIWGAAIVGSSRPAPLPPATEARVADFADLIAMAIANAVARAELTASRARIVAAADDARRRFERDLHDGAQQRLVSLGLKLRLLEGSVGPELAPLGEKISDVVSGLTDVATDLQQFSRGIHPAIVSKGGIGPALKSLARRSSVPVVLELGVDRRLPESSEVAAYYVVSEALTNVVKHARASEVKVSVDADGADLRLSIRDDGIGGADPRKGSGLVGLRDRVEALGGQLEIGSPAGGGTALVVTLPIEVRQSRGLAATPSM
ncbi:MAG TPA: GAF domain-containing protein [Mycobacterium sp.]|jgi:signal transduction histidine kinase|nr:GAF domain-containing protein [Mycobacterium sp.]